MRSITIKELHAETGRYIREAAQAPLQVTDRGRPIAVISGVGESAREVCARIRAFRGKLVLAKGETIKDLINAGRRI